MTDSHADTEPLDQAGATPAQAGSRDVATPVSAPGGVPADLNPLRAAGWIFRDGDCIEIERQSEEVRARVLAD